MTLSSSILLFMTAYWPIVAHADGGNHCNAIRETKTNCESAQKAQSEKVNGRVAKACDKLHEEEDKARDAAKKSCDDEKVTTEQNAGCLISASTQKDIDKCNAVGKRDLAGQANKAGADQKEANEKVRKARKELDEAIEAAKSDGDLTSEDYAALQDAQDASDEGGKVSKDISALQASDQSAGMDALTGGDTSADRSSALSDANPSDAAGGMAASADAPSGASPSDAPTNAAAGASPDSSSVPDVAGGQTLSAPQTAAGLGGASPAANAAPANASPGSAAPAGAAPSSGQGSGTAPVAGAALTPFVGTTPGGTSAAASLFGAEPAGNGGGASQLGPRVDAAAPRMSDQMREDLRARIDRASKGRSLDGEGGGVKLAGSLPRAEGWSGAGGGRAPASVEDSGPSEEEAAPAPGSPQFSSVLVGQRFSLLGSDTDAAVKRLVGQLDAAKAMASAEGIGESNGPSLFARSHAILQSALRRGFVRGVAVR